MNDSMGAPVRGLPRCIDVAVAVMLLALALPVLILLAILIAATSPGPIFFRHLRIGKNGRPFKMIKFRTMYVGRTGPQVTASADPRITAVGRVLRKTKLDELPELWNIVVGQMALVGPRPESAVYVDLSNALWREVLQARPGVTDPTTLRLRNEEDLLAAVPSDHEAFYRNVLLPYKLQGYRAYLSERTWRSDLVVLGQTLWAVLAPHRLPPPTLEDLIAQTPPPTERAGRLRTRRKAGFRLTRRP